MGNLQTHDTLALIESQILMRIGLLRHHVDAVTDPERSSRLYEVARVIEDCAMALTNAAMQKETHLDRACLYCSGPQVDESVDPYCSVECAVRAEVDR